MCIRDSKQGDSVIYNKHFLYLDSLMVNANTNIESSRALDLSLIHISEPTRQAEISYAVFCLKKKNNNNNSQHNLIYYLLYFYIISFYT